MDNLIITNIDKIKEILNHYGEELADVLIMSIQLFYFAGIRKEEVIKKFKYKVDRQLKRINAVG